MRRSVLSAFLLLAACAGAPETPSPTPAPTASHGLAAPVPEGVQLRIGAAMNGQTIDVAIGQPFAVELRGVPTAGYLWAPAHIPDFLAQTGQATGPTSQAQLQPGFAGGSHWEVLVFTASTAGEGELALEQRRPWETDQPPNDVFRVRLRAR